MSKDRPPTRRHGSKTLRSGIKVRTGSRYKFVVSVKRLTLKLFGAMLLEIEKAEGLVPARRFAQGFDYDKLVELCKLWKKNPDKQQDNNPNEHVHPRFMLLPYMDDSLIPEDARDGLFPNDGAGPILELTRSLKEMGVPCRESGVFDDEVLGHYLRWNKAQKAA